MNQFCKTIITFIITTILVMIILIIILYCCSKPESYESSNTVFIWGDSQTYQGIDLQELHEKTGLNIYTSAMHGAGVYDFLVFTEQIPDSSFCIVGYSQCCLLRRKDSDNNRSGANYKALKSLYGYNYSSTEIITILRDNKFVRKDIFTKTSTLYPYCDTIVMPEPIEGFKKMYDQEPHFYNDKLRLYKEGLSTLKNKGCKFIIVAFPYYKDVANIYKSSDYKTHIDKDIYDVASQHTNGLIDTIFVNDSDSLLMHDLTHFNEVGAKRASILLSRYIDTIMVRSNECRFIILNNWSCN